jgi:S-DNA-T family DNA segregation ATPase FtsK/SpoIIIE
LASRKKKEIKYGLKREIKQDIIGIAIIAGGLFAAVCLWNAPAGEAGDVHALGLLGWAVSRLLTGLFGIGRWLVPLTMIFLGICRILGAFSISLPAGVAIGTLTVSVCALLHLFFSSETGWIEGWNGQGGGFTGALFCGAVVWLMTEVGAGILFFAVLLASVLVISNQTFKDILGRARRHKLKESPVNGRERQQRGGHVKPGRELMETLKLPITKPRQIPDENPELKKDFEKNRRKEKEEVFTNGKELSADPSEPVESAERSGQESESPEHPVLVIDHHGEDEDSLEVSAGVSDRYPLPPLDLLKQMSKVQSQRLNKDITDNIKLLEETLASFGIKAAVTQVNRGPSITRYELQPPAGVKVSRIVNLADDLALALAAPQIRIEAPIPGKAAVGIEAPNRETVPVGLREVLQSSVFMESESKLTVAVGKDIAGVPVVADLGKMPHLLIAGSTGSGKSVCMNALIASILFNTHPTEVKMLMIDPKMVELSNYNGLPHLVSPVVTDAKKAASALRWAVHEMERRYELFAAAGVKDMIRYNQFLVSQETEDKERQPLPCIVILIDELADLMMVAPADVEDAICRLAQMARAAGMHLVVATQRPSVDVITGIIKANIPSRIAFAVSSQTDSRTILDMGGAERLLGKGDMLFYPAGKPKPVRVQGVFVSDEEIEALTQYLRDMTAKPEYMKEEFEVSGSDDGQAGEEDDELLKEAAKIFIESGQASISLLQRRLHIGYTRAGRIIDQLEKKGIVGGYEGSKARAIRMTWEEYEKRFGSVAL